MHTVFVTLLTNALIQVGFGALEGCSTNSSLQFWLNNLEKPRNVIVDFKSPKCQSFVSCYGHEQEDEISGDEGLIASVASCIFGYQ